MFDVRMARAAPALSIKQPWAELILCGRKDVEVRSWSDRYRGPIWLHTGVKLDEIAAQQFQMHSLFSGGLVGIAELTAIRPFTPELYESWRDRHLDFSPFPAGRDLFGWILSSVRRLDRPRKCRGALGLFHVDTSEITDEEMQLLVSDGSLRSKR